MAVKNKSDKAAEAATDHVMAEVVHLEPKAGATLVYDGKVYATNGPGPQGSTLRGGGRVRAGRLRACSPRPAQAAGTRADCR
jgi:hypothetical protein